MSHYNKMPVKYHAVLTSGHIPGEQHQGKVAQSFSSSVSGCVTWAQAVLPTAVKDPDDDTGTLPTVKIYRQEEVLELELYVNEKGEVVEGVKSV